MGDGALTELALPGSNFIIYSANKPSLLFIPGSAGPLVGPFSQKQDHCFGKTAPAVGLVSPGLLGNVQAAIELEACAARFGGIFGYEIKTAISIDPRAHGRKSLGVAVRSEQHGEVGNSLIVARTKAPYADGGGSEFRDASHHLVRCKLDARHEDQRLQGAGLVVAIIRYQDLVAHHFVNGKPGKVPANKESARVGRSSFGFFLCHGSLEAARSWLQVCAPQWNFHLSASATQSSNDITQLSFCGRDLVKPATFLDVRFAP